MRRLPWRVVLLFRKRYLVQLVDQLDRLQLERETSTPALSVELQLERLQEERLQSAAWEPVALLQDERLQLERL